MARTHLSGPVIVGDNKDLIFRNVGYAVATQSCFLDFSVSTVNAPGYSGGSGQYVTPLSNESVPTANQSASFQAYTGVTYPGNTNATLYTPSSTTYPPVPATPPLADTGTVAYRGCVFYLPINSKIENAYIDYGFGITVAGAGFQNIATYFSNNFAASGPNTNAIYGNTPAISSLGRQAISLATGVSITNGQATLADITQTTQPLLLSQVVANLIISSTSGLATPTKGKVVVTIQYIVSDPALGSTSAYPYDSLV